MTYGYSQFTIAANKSASKRSIGVALGRACIAHGVSVSAAAKKIGVSRQTIYNWFEGKHEPSGLALAKVEKFLASLSK